MIFVDVFSCSYRRHSYFSIGTRQAFKDLYSGFEFLYILNTIFRPVVIIGIIFVLGRKIVISRSRNIFACSTAFNMSLIRHFVSYIITFYLDGTFTTFTEFNEDITPYINLLFVAIWTFRRYTKL